MKLTNIGGVLPQSVVDGLARLFNSHPVMNDHSYSVTELQKGVKDIILARRHGQEETMSVQDAFPLLFGTMIHQLLQDTMEKDAMVLTEERLTYDMGKMDESLAGYTLTGGFDAYDASTSTLVDYKTCKIPSYQKALYGSDDNWKNQLFIYKLMLENAGFTVSHVKNICFLTDHSKVKASTDRLYPQNPIQVIDWDMELFNSSEQRASVFQAYSEKLKAVIAASSLADDDIEPCTPSERYEDESWAIIKNGGKRAERGCVFSSEGDARLVYENYDSSSYELVHRGGDPMKCRLYCSHKGLCSFYRSLSQRQQVEAVNE